jgi:hypothetical protein
LAAISTFIRAERLNSRGFSRYGSIGKSPVIERNFNFIGRRVNFCSSNTTSFTQVGHFLDSASRRKSDRQPFHLEAAPKGFFPYECRDPCYNNPPDQPAGIFLSFFRPSGPIAQLAELRTFNP